MLKTLVYADIFDYPLRLSEIKRWLIAGDDLTVADQIIKTKGYYHLQGRQKLVSLRRRRTRFSQLKRQKAQKIANILSLIPWIKMIALSGALAMNNADKDDDIDLFIVAQKDRLWLSRFLSLVIVQLFGLRRRPGENKAPGKICLNLWLDETALSIPKGQRNLYTAHEVAQTKPLFAKDKTYQKFITANLWLKKYLINWKV